MGQWEFQIGVLGAPRIGDEIWMGRYLLHRIAEDYEVSVSLAAKPVPGDWNGAGLMPTSPPMPCGKAGMRSSPPARPSAGSPEAREELWRGHRGPPDRGARDRSLEHVQLRVPGPGGIGADPSGGAEGREGLAGGPPPQCQHGPLRMSGHELHQFIRSLSLPRGGGGPMPEGCHPDASLRPLTVRSVTPLHVQLLRPSPTGRGRPTLGEALASAALAWFSPERLSCAGPAVAEHMGPSCKVEHFTGTTICRPQPAMFSSQGAAYCVGEHCTCLHGRMQTHVRTNRNSLMPTSANSVGSSLRPLRRRPADHADLLRRPCRGGGRRRDRRLTAGISPWRRAARRFGRPSFAHGDGAGFRTARPVK
jgi:hypothetical protein